MQPRQQSWFFRHLPILAKMMSPFIVAVCIFALKTTITGAITGNETSSVKTEPVEPTQPAVTERSNATVENTSENSTSSVKSTEATTSVPAPKPATPRLPIRLPNQLCKPRSSLIYTDNTYHKYLPLVVSLHRCGGACGTLPPTVSACKPKTIDKIPVYLFNRNLYRAQLVHMENHTSCECQCTQKADVCDPETQYFNRTLCQCKCKKDAERHPCPPNYMYEPSQCRCVCNLRCSYRQEYNASECSCTCLSRYFKRCNRKNKILDEETCRCLTPPGYSTRAFSCDEVPRKWVAMISVISCLTIMSILLLILLLTRSGGLCRPCRSFFSKTCEGCGEYSRTQVAEEKSPTIANKFDDNITTSA